MKADAGKANREVISKMALNTRRRREGNKHLANVWVTAMASMPLSAHVVVGSADSMITIYDLQCFEPLLHRIETKEMPTAALVFAWDENEPQEKANPTRARAAAPLQFSPPLALSHTPAFESSVPEGQYHCPEPRYEQVMCWGDSSGHVYTLPLNPEFGVTSDAGSKHRNEELLLQALSKWMMADLSPRYRRVDSTGRRQRTRAAPGIKAHDDWVTSLLYILELGLLVSTSLDSKVKMIDVKKSMVVREFSGHKKCVKTVAWSQVAKCLITGGTERSALIWNPYTTAVMAELGGHSSAIVSIAVDDKAMQVYTVTTDKHIRTWDLFSYTCLATLLDDAVYRPQNTLTASHWSQEIGNMYTAGNRMCIWQLKKKVEQLQHRTHADRICATLYASNMGQVITVGVTGSVRVWAIESGQLAFAFGDDQSAPIVCCARLDSSMRRLMMGYTAGGFGLWNFNNGQELQYISIVPDKLSVDARHDASFDSAAVTSNSSVAADLQVVDLCYVTVHRASSGTVSKYIACGDTNGNIQFFEETNTVADHPTMTLYASSSTDSATLTTPFHAVSKCSYPLLW
jgi:WD40 repeat protein